MLTLEELQRKLLTHSTHLTCYGSVAGSELLQGHFQSTISPTREAANMGYKWLWPDEAKFGHFGCHAKCHQWWKTNTARDPEHATITARHGNRRIMPCGLFSSTQRGKLVKKNEKTNSEKNKLLTLVWSLCSPSTRTMILNIEPELQNNGLDQSISMS